jgi:branched-chain amino acid transport system substrate-binding protein
MNFRTFAGLVIVTTMALGAARAQAQPAPIKMGILTELSGALGATGSAERDGFLLFLKQSGGKLGGRVVTTVIEDTASDPQTALSKVQKLVESDKVDFLLGPIGSATAAAIKPYVVAQQMPTLIGATVDEIGDGKYLFRMSFPANSDAFLQGYLAGHAGHKSAVIIAPNYNAGQSSAEYFEKGFAAAGGHVVAKLMPRLGTTDFAPYINQIPVTADVAIVFEPGTDGVRFIKQYGDFGKKLPLFGFPSTVDESSLPAEGKAAEGFVGAAHYFSTVKVPENERFVRDWQAAYHSDPGWQGEAGYLAALVMDQAIRKQPDVRDREALLRAMKGVRVRSPAGEVRFDDNNNTIAARYIMQIRPTATGEAPFVFGTLPNFTPEAKVPTLPRNIVFPR